MAYSLPQPQLVEERKTRTKDRVPRTNDRVSRTKDRVPRIKGRVPRIDWWVKVVSRIWEGSIADWPTPLQQRNRRHWAKNWLTGWVILGIQWGLANPMWQMAGVRVIPRIWEGSCWLAYSIVTEKERTLSQEDTEPRRDKDTEPRKEQIEIVQRRKEREWLDFISSQWEV